MGVVLKSVKPCEDFVLEAEFTDGAVKRYDISPLFHEIPVFMELKENPELFRNVKVIGCGYAVGWNDDLDLACEEIYENGKAV